MALYFSELFYNYNIYYTIFYNYFMWQIVTNYLLLSLLNRVIIFSLPLVVYNIKVMAQNVTILNFLYFCYIVHLFYLFYLAYMRFSKKTKLAYM